jgi:hypothetical protein
MLFEEEGEWITYEFREFVGWRRWTLEQQLQKYGDTIDVYRPISRYGTKEWNEEAQETARQVMLSWEGQEYGWRHIVTLVLRYLPLLRLLPQDTGDNKETDAFVCSTAVAVALRRSYADPVPTLADRMVTPPALARSALLEFQFQLKAER